MDNLTFCSGEYINIFNGIKDCFVIINEPNEPTDVEKNTNAEKIVRKYFDSENVKQMKIELEEIFKYGVQVFFRNR